MMPKIRSILISIFFLVGLELLTLKTERYWFIFCIFTVLAILGTYFTVRRNFPEGDRTIAVLPIFYFIGIVLIQLYIFKGVYQHIFVAMATIVFYYLITKGIHWAYPTWNWLFTYVTFFLVSAGTYGLFFHLYFNFYLIAAIISLSTFLLTFQILRRANILVKEQYLYSFVTTLIIFEFLWFLSFWPSTYIVVSGILLVIYYTMVELINQSIYHHLNWKVILSYIVFFFVAILAILGTSEWLA